MYLSHRVKEEVAIMAVLAVARGRGLEPIPGRDRGLQLLILYA
jgi:hypothetical protein